MWAVAAADKQKKGREEKRKLRKRLSNIYTQLARKTESIIEKCDIYGIYGIFKE